MLWMAVGAWLSCAGGGPGTSGPTSPGSQTETDGATGTDAATDVDETGETGTKNPGPLPRADVTAVSTSGSAGSYTFSVTLASDDTGCEQYADWWEVVTPKGDLVYRRILTHSHVGSGSNPFTRSGGPVAVGADDELVVRAHMNPSGYVGDVMRGTVSGGFGKSTVAEGFAASIEHDPPQPKDCLF